MALILRVDVDKPYGRNTSFEKIKSKLREDYWFPKVNALGYLKATEEFIKYCNQNKVRGFFYFRNCTTPNKTIWNLLKEGNHKVGFHAENTRSLEKFKAELETFCQRVFDLEVSSFTKHGSGDTKLGRTHYAPYEEDKYRAWANDVKVKFPFGNGMCNSEKDFENCGDFYPKMFWIHNAYRQVDFSKIDDALRVSMHRTVPIIIHPSNFIADAFVRREFQELVSLSNQKSIPWVVDEIV